MNGSAEFRRVDVLSNECAVSRQQFGRSVEVHVIVRHLSPALAREHEHRRDTTVDVRPAVSARGARPRRQRIELLFDLVQVYRERLEHVAPFVKRELAKIGPADIACVIEYGREIQARTGDGCNGFTVDGGRQEFAVAIAFDPLVLYEITEFHRRYRCESDLKKSVSQYTVKRTGRKQPLRGTDR